MNYQKTGEFPQSFFLLEERPISKQLQLQLQLQLQNKGRGYGR